MENFDRFYLVSYWSGAWETGQAPNPMRYAGGLLGGSWVASFTADVGNGIFDGAYLGENFEYLNPANAVSDKQARIEWRRNNGAH